MIYMCQIFPNGQMSQDHALENKCNKNNQTSYIKKKLTSKQSV